MMSSKTNARQRMIKAAFNLLHERGVHATSIDAVLERSRTGKSQFSYYFKTKNGLVDAVLRQFLDELKKGAYDPVQSIQSWKDLDIWTRSFLRWQQNVKCTLACPIGTIANDLSQGHKGLRREIRQIFAWRRAFIADFFRREQAAGRMRKNFTPRTLADFCYTITQGGLYMAKAERDIKPFENALDTALVYLLSLRIPTKKRI